MKFVLVGNNILDVDDVKRVELSEEYDNPHVLVYLKSDEFPTEIYSEPDAKDLEEGEYPRSARMVFEAFVVALAEMEVLTTPLLGALPEKLDIKGDHKWN